MVGITGSVRKDEYQRNDRIRAFGKIPCVKDGGNFNNEIGLPLTIFRLSEEDEVAVLEMGISVLTRCTVWVRSRDRIFV